KLPLQTGQQETSLLLMKNMCICIEEFFVLCYYNHVYWDHNTKSIFGRGEIVLWFFLFTSMPI
ncbi:hypothetical protein, partial [Parasporobacterium paucivorans]|uniref:hypothetical protein n=1 Tax=Parasporobacterium paucivorans TaxID=115544 RepID=UPI001A9A539F